MSSLHLRNGCVEDVVADSEERRGMVTGSGSHSQGVHDFIRASLSHGSAPNTFESETLDYVAQDSSHTHWTTTRTDSGDAAQYSSHSQSSSQFGQSGGFNELPTDGPQDLTASLFNPWFQLSSDGFASEGTPIAYNRVEYEWLKLLLAQPSSASRAWPTNIEGSAQYDSPSQSFGLPEDSDATRFAQDYFVMKLQTDVLLLEASSATGVASEARASDSFSSPQDMIHHLYHDATPDYSRGDPLLLHDLQQASQCSDLADDMAVRPYQASSPAGGIFTLSNDSLCPTNVCQSTGELQHPCHDFNTDAGGSPQNLFCRECRGQKGEKGFSSSGLHNLLEHILAKHFNMRIYCPVPGCGKKFSHATSLRRHIWSPSKVGKHRDVFDRLMESQSAATSGTSATVICSKCPHLHLHRDRFEDHVRKVHLSAQFSCPIPGCTQHFTRFVHLDKHVQENHKDVLKRYVGGMDTD